MELTEAFEEIQNRPYTMMQVNEIEMSCPTCGITLIRDVSDPEGQLFEKKCKREILPWHEGYQKDKVCQLSDKLDIGDFLSQDRVDTWYTFGVCPACNGRHRLMELWITSRPCHMEIDHHNDRGVFKRPKAGVPAEDVLFYVMHDRDFILREWTLTRFVEPNIIENGTKGPLVLDRHVFGPLAMKRPGAFFDEMARLVTVAGSRWTSLVGKELKATI